MVLNYRMNACPCANSKGWISIGEALALNRLGLPKSPLFDTAQSVRGGESTSLTLRQENKLLVAN